MRLRDIRESTGSAVLDRLVNLWKSNRIEKLISTLQGLDDDQAKFVADLLVAGIKKADENPEMIFDLVDELLEIESRLPLNDQGAIRSVIDYIARAAVNDDKVFKLLIKKADVMKIAKRVDSTLGAALKLSYSRLTRTAKEKKFDKDNETFVFIGRPGFREDPPGSENYKKTLEIERLVPIDRFDIETHKMIGMMKLRAVYQGENSRVYSVSLPKGTVDPNHTLPNYLIDIIDKYKTEIKS